MQEQGSMSFQSFQSWIQDPISGLMSGNSIFILKQDDYDQFLQDYVINDQNQETEKVQERPTAQSTVNSMEISLKPYKSTRTVDYMMNLNSGTKVRQSNHFQSNSQKILKFTTKAHITKNLPAQIFRKLKNYLKKIGRLNLLNGQSKRFSVEELNAFIMESGLTQEEWNEILDLGVIYKLIDKSKKLGTSKHFDKISQKAKEFLVYLNKQVQKIIWRSAKRVIRELLKGESFVSYLDSKAHSELRELDSQLMSSKEYSTEYTYFLSQLNKEVTKGNKNRQ